MNNNFIHLRLHTEFSINDSTIKINKILEKVKKDKQPSIAITDFLNIFGSIKFYKKARKLGIKPIIGCDILISNKNNNKSSRLLFLIKNYNGYLHICNLLSKAWIKNIKNNKAIIKFKWIKKIFKKNNNDLIILSGAHLGNIGKSINNGNFIKAKQQAKNWKKIFKKNFYIEIQRIKQPNMELQILKSLEIANKLNIPIVATQPIQFQKKKDFLIHEIRTCISENKLLKDKKRKKKFTKEQYFKTKKEMCLLFKDIPEAILNTIEIAKKCNFSFKLGKVKLPKFFKKKNIINNIFFKIKTKQGLKKKLKIILSKKKNKIETIKKYFKRINYEINTIIKMNFSNYFLIVADFINWSKKNNIPVGPGRGSGTSSLVAFSLNITNVDPIKYNLLFERFLNEERTSIPDFDIDFCQKKRDIVIKYIKNKYGVKSVVQIATFGTMAARGVIRDVGRILGLNYSFCDNLVKLIPFKQNKLFTIAEYIKKEQNFKKKIESNKEIKKLIFFAQKLEGIIKNISTHAGGIIISPKKITNFCPLYFQEKNSIIISQYDKEDIKKIGLIKFDFLGLTTLTIIEKTLSNIKKQFKIKKKLSINNIPLNNKKTFKLLSQAKTIAVFQLESLGMQKMLKNILPDKFKDIIIIISLYRPGPIELIEIFCKRKHGENFSFIDKRIKNILLETYGIMIYQEQIMKIAQIIAGYSLKKADLLQRIMSSKNKIKMLKQKKTFIKGAIKNGLSIKKSNKIFNLIEKFSGYGFNKAHATAYALISYYTAYLKTNYTIYFMAANLSLAMNETKKIKILIKDSIYTCKIKILPPNINFSFHNFKPIKKDTISFGLCAIKGLGKNIIKNIINERKKGIFKNFLNFIERINKIYINKKTLKAFITSGAFDCFKISRPIMYTSINKIILHAEKNKKFINQLNLFENKKNFKNFFPYKKKITWDIKKIIKKEKKVLGFCFLQYPYNLYKK
ncbi:DNA polymerase III subunit alpha [Candidatus Zinderia endosymbiont of Aphrophora alni]|uniref:DNA polymerase III subunit alpha n=1 Tax=Candidatus Zinderia endosymbiont of Aphrophora alni TaxID=3077951 RepID=UPI0030CB0C62